MDSKLGTVEDVLETAVGSNTKLSLNGKDLLCSCLQLEIGKFGFTAEDEVEGGSWLDEQE
jgi:hypothetical protein